MTTPIRPITGSPTVLVASHERGLAERLAELWSYRHLVGNLVLRDLKVRYKNSVLGLVWSLAGPLLMMLVFTFVFDYLQHSAIPHFAVFVLVGILPWNWFNAAVRGGLYSIVHNAPLINKVYFPREILPISAVLSELVNFLFAMPVLLVMLFVNHIPITGHLAWLPVIILIQAAFTLGAVFFLSTANVYYRDTGMIMDVVLLAWFFMTPIIYDIHQLSASTVPLVGMNGERFMYWVNPMASLVASYRVIIYGSPLGPPTAPDLLYLLRTALTAVVVLVVGYAVFIRHSGQFGEEV